MKKDLFNLKLRSRWLLVSLLALLAGASPAWAQETETFEDVTIQKDGEDISNNYGNNLSNGWICVNSSGSRYAGIYSSDAGSYALGTDYSYEGNKSLFNTSSSNSYYMVIPVAISGTVSFQMRCTSISTSYQGMLYFYNVTDNGDGTYTIGSQIGSYVNQKGGSGWASKEFNVGEEETMVAIRFYRAAIDNFTYTPYVEAGCKKPKSLSISNITSSSADFSWTKGDDGDTAWQIVYSTDANFDKDAATPIDVNTTSYSFSELNPNTTYYVAVRTYAGSGEGKQSAWVTTNFKTEKVATPATGFTDNFETNKGWDLINGTCPNKWVIGTGTNNGGSKSLYISKDGTSYASSGYGSSSLVYASMLLRFEAGDYTVSYDWMCYGEGTYDFMRVGLVPASVELTASTSYSSLGSGSTLPTGWTRWLDGGSKLGGSTTWATKSVDFTIAEAGNYQVVFAWRNDYSGGSTPAAIDNFKILGSAPVLELGGDVVGTTLAFGSVNETTNKTITITNSGKVAMENIALTETADDDNVFAYAELPKTSLAANESMDVTVTFSGSSAKDYTGTFRVSADDCNPIDVTVTATYSNSAATMAVTLDEAAVDGTVAFGSVGKQAVKTFTITNDGDQTLNVMIASDNTTDFTVSPAALAVTGHSSETFTVTFVYPNESPILDAEKTAQITVTPSNEGLVAKTFAVTGTRIEQWSEDFSGSSLPEGWEITNGTYWKLQDNMLKGSYSYQNYDLITPSLVVEEGQTLSFDYRMTSTYRSLEIQYSKDNGAWTNYATISYSGLTLNLWYTYTIEGLEAGNYKFRFGDSNYDLDNFEGFKRNMNDPKMGIYTDAGCTAAAATSVTKVFDFVTSAPEAQVYYLKNDGTGTLTLALGDVPTGFTAVLGTTSLAAKESTTLTINMPVETKGYRSGDIVVTAKNSSDVVLGTFTVAASGVVVDENKLNLNFAIDNIPASWTNSSFTKNANGYIESPYGGGTLQTSALTAEAGETIVIIAKQGYSSTSYTTAVNYRKVGEEEWSSLIAAENIYNNASWKTLTATIEESGNYELQFVGRYVHIQRIYGLAEALEPVMAVYDGESLAGASYSFDNVSNEDDATWTLTVKNEGKATLTGLAAALTGDNADHYSVEVSATELAVNATATIIVTQLKDNLGSHSATLTILADDPVEDKVIELSGFTYDHNKLFVDFEDNAFPTGWSVGTSWVVTTPYSSTAHHAQQGNLNTASALITTPLTVGENEKLTFDAARLYSNSAPELKVRYTTNGGVTWSEYVDYASQVTSSNYVKLELTGVPAGTTMVEFYGRYIKIDNIYGFTPTTAAVMALTENSVAVENGSTKEFGTLTADATATYVLSNTGNGDLVSTLDSDVVTFEVTTMDEGVNKSENTLTIPAGKSATIVVTMPYVAPFIAKNGSLTITSAGWVPLVTLNYTATLVDETALYEDFASNAKPAGWYQETSGWLFTQGTAHVYTGVDKEIITEKYGAEAGKNVLSFDAKLQSTGADGELKVYTSTDRKAWTLAKTVTLTAENQAVALDALADGENYVKFVSLNASIDNLAGLKRLTAPEHDLYVSATTFPTATLIPETENGVNASATVNSLRADETGVYAKLFFDETEVATADAQDIAKDGNKTFNFTANVPSVEKTYAAKIVVYYSDNSVAWETATTNVEVAHTRTLSITGLTRTSDATVDADGNNQFTSTFNVTVQNNGTLAQTAANVSVSITDAEGNVIGENATAWTKENSQTIFVTPGDYTTADAVLALYSWGKAESWSRLTETNIAGFYSGELNGNTNFRIVRLKPSTAEGYDAENDGLNDANIWNRSTDMTTSDGNVFTFKSWDDKTEGDGYHWFTYGTMGELAVGISTTMSVSVTTSALEGGVFTFKAKENVSNTVSTGSAAVTVNAAAPKFELALNSTAIENGDAVAYGIVKEATTKTFTISNTGNKLMEAPSISVPEGYEYERVAANGAEADWILFFYRNGTNLDADQGHFMATATDGKFIIENVNVPYEGVNFAVHKKNGNDWYDIYGYSSESEGGHLNTIAKATKLATATEASGWMTIPTGSYDFIWNANDLTLLAKPAGSILAGETADVNVTLKAEQGKKSGNLTFTYKVDASTNSTFDVALSGRSISADTWVEEFTAEIPATWTNNGWEWNSDRKAAYSGYSKGHELMTPRLAAENGEELTFDVIFPYSNEQLKVQYSTDKTNWNDVATYVSTANNQTFEGSFTAPAEGNYYLKFGDSNSRYVYVDNLCGFKLSIPEHDTEIAASSLPETGKQYNVYTATVTLKENAGKAEEVTANLYVDGEVKATETQTITANGSTVVTLTWEPQEVISEAVNAYVAVTGTGIDLATEPVSLTIAEVYTLDEATSAATIDVVSNETVLLKRTFIAGWNTVCLPLAINDVEAFFGEGAKAYNFTGYNDDVLSFSTVDELTASYPYVVYVPAAITEPMKLQNITITSNNNEGFYSYSNGVYFRGTYAPIAAPGMEGKWGVTTDAHIAKGTESASIKGFRAYFEGIGEDLTNARMSFTDLATGITQVIEPKPFGDNRVYNLNGQHVENAKKGLYIVNGKKVVIK